METVILVLLGLSIAGLIYIRLNSRTRIWRFGILPERLFCQLASLREEFLDLDSVTYEGDFYIVIPVESKAISRLPVQMYEGETELIALRPLLETSEEDDSILAVELVTHFGRRSLAEKLKKSRSELEKYARLKLIRQKLGQSPPRNYVTHLAIELIAPGFEIGGEQKQRQDLKNPRLAYTWGITAKSSGNHAIALVLRGEDETGTEVAQIGIITHSVRVVSILGLTHRQVRILAGVLGLSTALLAILEALQQLHVIP